MIKIGEIKVSVQELGLKQGFFFTEIWIISLQGGLGPTILKVMPISICSPKSMGKKLQNELWARSVASKLSERRPLTFFSPSGHGKWAKTLFFFRILSNYSNAKNFKMYPGMPY